MIRLALKNIWACKKRSGWLLAELVAVSIILWHLLDPLMVQTYVDCLPDGFDSENLYRIELNEYPSESSFYRADAGEHEQRIENVWRIRERVSRYSGVESATFQIGALAPGSTACLLGRNAISDTLMSVFTVHFVPKSDYFTTFRYRTFEGLSPKQLDQMDYHSSEFVCTDPHFPGKSVLGWNGEGDNEVRVVASLYPVKMRMTLPPQQVEFLQRETPENAWAIVFRLRDGIDPDDFLPAFRDWAKNELQLGNYYVGNIESYQDFIKQSTSSADYDYLIKVILACFFLFCAFFGVSGTFWMQTRSRCEEIGILKSFGATSGRTLRLFLFEGIGLVTVAVLLGCVIYLQYALHSGLYFPQDVYFSQETCCSPYVRYWYESFRQHFLIVSGVVWLLMVLIVSFGIYVPMRGISRITPTEALHEE